MDGAVGAASQDGRDEDDEEDYEEVGGGNRLLGFMFGNVDWSGDLDVDYLDEDAKEHLSALADKLGPSLTDIDLIKSSPAHTDASEQDYDEKAEDAIDYEDIDEQYDGPEIQATTEEDHLLPKKEYFSSDALLASLDHKASVFDEENYDEDEETVKENEALGDTLEIQSLPSAGEQSEMISIEAISSGGNLPSAGSPEAEDMALELEDVQEEPISPHEQADFRRDAPSLPILYIEDGMVILRFSEIFGVHEPLRKTERKDHQRYSVSKEWVKTLDIADIVEESEEAFLRSSYHDLSASKNLTLTLNCSEDDAEHAVSGLGKIKDSCLCAQPMKDDHTKDLSTCQSPLSPRFYPLDQQDWEDAILWGNSPTASHGCSQSCIFSEPDSETHTDSKLADGYGHRKIKLDEKEPELDSHALDEPFGSRKLSVSTYNRASERRNIQPDEKELELDSPILGEPFGSSKLSVSTYNKSLEKSSHHPQLLRLESLPRKDELFSAEIENETGRAAVCRGDILHRFSKLSLQNKALLEGSWLDDIIWDPEEAIRKPKLILDLQDEQMVFEVLDQKDHEHLSSHAGAMMMMHSSKPYIGDSFEHHGQGMTSVGRFNISNDKYYSNRKISQQVKSHAKKRAFLGIKVMHSVPALKLQTMKPKLSNKDISNFHRPKALWFPHDNEIVAKAQGMLRSSGTMKIILATLGGKATKLHVNAEETIFAIKLRASKKLEIKPSEQVKVFYSGKELEDDKSLAVHNVRPSSVLHIVRTRVYLWPRAQKLPGENKPLRPPGAFKKKTDLSLKDGHVFLMESCEERPLLLGNVGMGARLCTYYQKTVPSDQTASSLRNGNDGLGTVITLEPSDKSPFLGDIGSGHRQSCLETNMYRAPVFPHNLSTTDYLLVRSAKGMLSLRRIDKLYVVGQQEPHMEVLSPGTKNVQTYLVNRMLVYVYREFRAKEKPGLLPLIRADELAAQFPNLTDAFIRKRMKHCADLKKGPKGQLIWVKRHDFRIPSEEELRRIVAPENVCSYESMQAGLYRLKRLGVSRLTHPVGLSSAMNQLPDEAITLAAASHIERELQITSWNLTSNFVACTNQNRENIERLEITGVGDPSGRGLGFSYVRVTPKAPISSAVVKKKAAAARVGSSVTGTDADLRRLSMDAAREVLLKFNVPEEQIEKLTRWHRIALVRKLSSEQAASGVKVDAMTLSKFARGQRMSFLQLQQQTREKCQEIWDRQVQSLSAAAGVENDSDSEANSDLDSFAGDLENLLDAEEFEEEEVGNTNLKGDKADVVRGLKMRRGPSQVQTEEEIEDDKAEAALLLRLLEDDEAEIMMKKKKKKPTGSQIGYCSQLGPDNVDSTKKTTFVRHIGSTPILDDSFSPNEIVMWENKDAEKILAERNSSGKVKSKKGSEKSDEIAIGIVKKKTAIQKDGAKVFKEKKQAEKPEKPTREGFVCGACGQVGHMRTNKNCPKYGDDVETSERESVSVKPSLPDVASEQLKTPSKKISKVFKAADLDMAETAKTLPIKFKCGSYDKLSEKSLPRIQPTKEISVSSEKETTKSTVKISIVSNKMKSEHVQHESPKPAIVTRPPVDGNREKPQKKIIIKQPKGNSDVDEFRKVKKITEISSFEKQRQESQWFAEEGIRERAMYEKRLRDEEEKRRRKERIAEEKAAARIVHDQRLLETIRYEEARRTEERQKAKKKKKKKPEFRDEYFYEDRYRNDRRTHERDRAAKRRPAVSLGRSDYAPPTKRRRGGEVELSNILETILDTLKKNIEVSYLFLKPVTKKEAPDYYDIIKSPMDLSTIREKVRKMEYKSREDFRHDVWQITLNAHIYNDGRNPGIPPLADQLLELCDYHLQQFDYNLIEAESVIEA